jgi:hypothetical protein
MGTDVKEDSTQPVIELDPRELLGLSQVAKVSNKTAADGHLLSKVGEGPGPVQPSRISRLLSKIGGEGPQQSDLRLKTDVRQVGTTAHDLPLYTFRYIGKDGQYEGVMAQDVLKVMPLAVSVGEDGYYRVNYDMLGIPVANVSCLPTKLRRVGYPTQKQSKESTQLSNRYRVPEAIRRVDDQGELQTLALSEMPVFEPKLVN